MLPREIEEIFEKYSVENYAFNLKGADYSDNTITLSFEITFTDNDESTQEWIVNGIEHRKNKIIFGTTDFIEIFEESPLLWEFTDIQSELYYSGKINEPEKLLYELFMIHKKLFNEYKQFELFPGEYEHNFKPFQYDSGLLAKGPRKLLQQYADYLQSSDINYSIIGERLPTYWNGVEHIDETSLKLLLFGDSYIVAKDFLFHKK